MMQKIITLALLVIAAICLIAMNITNDVSKMLIGLILAVITYGSASILLMYRNKSQRSQMEESDQYHHH